MAVELHHLIHGNIVNQSLDAGVDDGDLLSEDQGAELGLLEQLTQALAATQLLLSGRIKI